MLKIGKVKELVCTAGKYRIKVSTPLPENIKNILKTYNWEINENYINVSIDDINKLNLFIDELRKVNINIYTIEKYQNTLEEIFIELINKQ